MKKKYAARNQLLVSAFVLAVTGGQAIADEVIRDDLIVQGSKCVGVDCVNGEVFNFNTLKLKENNLRIRFQDTSGSASFPSNDWQITINDSSNGGQNKFSIEDIDAGSIPFTIEAGAASHGLYLNSQGSLGIGTSSPASLLHLKSGDSPALRFDQDVSGGFEAQTWSIGGNEASLYVADETTGSTPFQIRAGAPTNSLFVASDGDVGIDTSTPDGIFDIASPANQNAHAFLVSSNGFVGIDMDNDFVPNHPIEHGNGAHLTSGGVWTDASSRALKEQISEVDLAVATDALMALKPVTFVYKRQPDETYVGFVAEDVPELVATNDRKGLAPMDVTAVLTKVVQEQQRLISELNRRLSEVEASGGR